MTSNNITLDTKVTQKMCRMACLQLLSFSDLFTPDLDLHATHAIHATS